MLNNVYLFTFDDKQLSNIEFLYTAEGFVVSELKKILPENKVFKNKNVNSDENETDETSSEEETETDESSSDDIFFSVLQ